MAGLPFEHTGQESEQQKVEVPGSIGFLVELSRVLMDLARKHPRSMNLFERNIGTSRVISVDHLDAMNHSIEASQLAT